MGENKSSKQKKKSLRKLARATSINKKYKTTTSKKLNNSLRDN